MPLDKPLTDSRLTKELLKHDSVLCIVNTRRHAQALFAALSRAEPRGAYHLSTTMYPAHRRRILEEIRGRLKAGLTCRVISTSLVEAGVDLDFACVYRAQAGLDSIIQAAGRCNREGRRMASESIVYIFDSENHRSPTMIQPNIDAYRQVAGKRADLSDLGSIRNYFEQLFCNLGKERLDENSVVKRFDDGAAASMSFPFKDVAEQFRLIDNAAQQSIYVLHEVHEICERLRKGERGRDLFRLIGAYAVNLYEFDIGKLLELGAIERLDESVWLLTEAYYDKQMGVLLSPEGGVGLFA
jgi:CRISPR-associated endonuclease/helicase Cas3